MSLEEFRGKALAPPSRLPDEEAEEARRDVFRFWRVFIRERVERWDGRIEEARTKRRAPYKGWTDDLKLAVRGLAGQIESEDVLDTLALEMNAIESGANVPQETLREAMELYQALVQLTQVFPRAMDANREVHREQQMVAEDGTIDMLGRLSAKREALGKAS